MTPLLEVLVPVLDRPKNVVPFITSLYSTRQDTTTVRECFLVSPGDKREQQVIEGLGLHHFVVPFFPGRGDYARKINYGAYVSDAEWLLLGADDLDFHRGWLEACLDAHEQTGALVLGTQDLGNPLVLKGKHSTHPLVHTSYRKYGTIDQHDLLLHEGYEHNCVDIEFVETAIARDKWAFVRDAVVEHLHPRWNKGTDDATYRRGDTTHLGDLRLLRQRRRLWGAPTPRSGRRMTRAHVTRG